ncbi:unnamed product [Ostreococcus tauri]|uniref:Unnamed product n=1 Tax=Ostreococcus tauri TaxID=70448 RepID=A0A090M9L4_OSTTA|nr:unnamed product [Ostreococcus tauri]CEF98834.1 unnamed product [Ostreococcus tauri]|eukprot:XP_022839497.1 unnamed product [Ostreococcus tauri]
MYDFSRHHGARSRHRTPSRSGTICITIDITTRHVVI